MVDTVFENHPDAEVTFITHLPAEEPDREPLVGNNGKHMVLFPPFPQSQGFHCFHPKLILIRFQDRLRVVISSSNLMEEDWTRWSQCVWMQVAFVSLSHDQDFFSVSEGESKVAEKKLDLEFRTRLIQFLRQCSCPDDRVFNLLRGVCFKDVRVRLVTSVPNVYRKANMNEYGHLRVRTILRSLDEYHASRDIPAQYPPILSLCSSVGTPSANWLHSILASCHGGRSVPEKTTMDALVHMVYPTEQCVKESAIGADMAGSLILHSKTYAAKSFPKKCLKRYKNVKGREGALPHAKYCECSEGV